MSYQAALIGEIDIEGKNIGTLELGPADSLEDLTRRYGLIGRGFDTIFHDPTISAILQKHDVGSIQVSNDNVHGLDNLPASTQNVLTRLLQAQYERSERMYETAQRSELEELDAVALGVAKGVGLGGIPAVWFDALGYANIFTELASRAGPGLIEAAAISEEVEKVQDNQKKADGIFSKFGQRLESIADATYAGINTRVLDPLHAVAQKQGKFAKLVLNTVYHTTRLPLDYLLNNGKDTKESLNAAREFGIEKDHKTLTNFLYHPINFTFGLAVDTKNIIKRSPAGLYKAINVCYWIDKWVLKKEIKLDDEATNTKVWSDAQESGPWRGLIALGGLKYADFLIRGSEEMPGIYDSFMNGDLETATYALAAGVVLGLSKFWVNTGNNVQGMYAVYRRYFKECESESKWEKRKYAWKKLMDDGFQKAQGYICTGIFGFATGLEWLGLQAEKLNIFGTALGNTGATAQSAAQSGDTAYSALIAKPVIKNKLTKPARKSVSDLDLMQLAKDNDDYDLIDRIKERPKQRWEAFENQDPVGGWLVFIINPAYRALQSKVILPRYERANAQAYQSVMKGS